MNSIQGLLLAIGWFLIRFGLPLLLTLILIYSFSKLDSRWRDEAIEQRNKAGYDQIIPSIRCWVFHDCPPEKREKCPAFQEKNVPCWQLFRDQYGVLKQGCLDCDVFTGATVPLSRR